MNRREDSDVIFSKFPQGAAVLSAFHQAHSHSTGALALLISGCLAKSVSASLICSSPPERGRGSSPYPWQSTLSISGSKASFGGLQLVLAAAQGLLRAPWLSLHLACPHLVLAWLCSPALFEPVFSLLSISTSLPLQFWHCPLSGPRDFPGHSRSCSHCRCEWWG